MRFRRQVAFDRLLARVFSATEGQWALKGGYSLELRLTEARTTRDLDLTLLSASGLEVADTISVALQAELQRLVALDIGDFFEFVVESATLDIEAAPYGGARFPKGLPLASAPLGLEAGEL